MRLLEHLLRFRAPRPTDQHDTAGATRGGRRRPALLAAAVAAVALLPLSATTATAATAAPDPAVTPLTISAPAVAALTAPALAPAAPARTSAMELALGKLGKPYRWGATGPNAFDCSGLVHWAFAQTGVDLPRTSRAMATVGTPVARGDLQPGDLVFFYRPVSHVGIYLGEGQMVHASTSGQPVKISPIEGRKYHSARRI